MFICFLCFRRTLCLSTSVIQHSTSKESPERDWQFPSRWPTGALLWSWPSPTFLFAICDCFFFFKEGFLILTPKGARQYILIKDLCLWIKRKVVLFNFLDGLWKGRWQEERGLWRQSLFQFHFCCFTSYITLFGFLNPSELWFFFPFWKIGIIMIISVRLLSRT